MEEKQFNKLKESMNQAADIMAGKTVLVPKESINQAIKQFADEVLEEIDEAMEIEDVDWYLSDENHQQLIRGFEKGCNHSKNIIQQAKKKRGIE